MFLRRPLDNQALADAQSYALLPEEKLQTESLLKKLSVAFAMAARSGNESVLKSLVIPTMIEVSIAMGCAALTDSHLPDDTAWYARAYETTFPFLLFNFLTRLISTSGTDPQEIEKRHMLAVLRACSFTIIDIANRSRWLHEQGHAMIGRLMYSGANPEIVLRPFLGSGVTYINGHTPTHYYDKIGPNNAQTFISAAGTGATLLWNHLALIVAQLAANYFPELTHYLRIAVFVDMVSSIAYAFSAYKTHDDSDDFRAIKDYDNIDPTAAAAFIFGSLFFLQTLLTCCAYSRVCKPSPQSQAKIEEISDDDAAYHDLEQGPVPDNEMSGHDNPIIIEPTISAEENNAKAIFAVKHSPLLSSGRHKPAKITPAQRVVEQVAWGLNFK